MTFEPHRIICVFCVHLLPASAQKSFLSLPRHEADDACEPHPHHAQSERPPRSPVRSRRRAANPTLEGTQPFVDGNKLDDCGPAAHEILERTLDSAERTNDLLH